MQDQIIVAACETAAMAYSTLVCRFRLEAGQGLRETDPGAAIRDFFFLIEKIQRSKYQTTRIAKFAYALINIFFSTDMGLNWRPEMI